MAAPDQLARFPSAEPSTGGQHVLVLPEGVDVEEIEALAVSRFPAAVWDTADAEERASARGRSERGYAPVQVLRLSRHARLIGPYALELADATSLGVNVSASIAYLVETPPDRGERPYPGGDREGINRAFPDGLPVRDEERVVRWLVAVARRVGGSVRVAPSGVVLAPDVHAEIDLTVYSDVWLEPQAALEVMRRVAPGAQLAMDPVPWAGPPPGIGESGAPGTTGLSAALRKHLHAEADAFDVAALSAPDELNGYGVQKELGVDGAILLEVAGEDALPIVLQALPWAQAGAVTYRVRWEPPEFEELERERPSFAHRVARDRVENLVGALAREVHRAVGGEVLDSAEFLVDPADL